MEKRLLQKKLLAYSTLGAGFLALSPHQAEGQIVYVNLPDHRVCADQAIDNDGSCNFKSDYRFIHLDLDGIKMQVTTQIDGIGTFQPKNNTDVLFIANAFVIDNDPINQDNRGHAFAYGYNLNWDAVSNFLGTATNGYIKLLQEGDNIGPGELRATNGRGIMPGIIQSTDGSGAINTSQIGNPDFINSAPSNSFTGYVGVAFEANGNTHYGWIQLLIEQEVDIQVTGMGGEHHVTCCMEILDYAYSAAPDTPIKAGDGTLPADTIPTMGEWAFLSLALTLLSFGTLYLDRQKSWSFAGNEGAAPISFQVKTRRLPFYRGSFKKATLFSSLVASVLLLLSTYTQYTITITDILGGFTAGMIFTYWLHLLLENERKEN